MSEEYYDCSRLCTSGGRLVSSARLTWRCALPDFDESRWAAPSSHEHMGGPCDEHGAKRGESTEDGCPGSWYRTPYIASLLRYQRQRDANGGLSENHLLTRCNDLRVHEAIAYLEHERNRCSNYLDEIRLGHK